MSARITRRRFTGLAGGALAGTTALLGGAPRHSRAQGGEAAVVVVGGGLGGASAAKYLRLLDPALRVTLVEPAASFVTCPFSNLVIGGLKPMAAITHGYARLRDAHGIDVVRDTAVGIDAEARRVRLAGGGSLGYDRLLVSPGIDLRFDAVPGYDERAALRMPHAWKAGDQTRLLRRQLEAMPDGGTVLICPPGNPFRCPPGPYERASLVAHYLKENKPRSKIIVLDAKEKFSKGTLFMNAWQELYGDTIEWRSGAAGGRVEAVAPEKMTVRTEFGDERGDVVNFIPPQRAGAIAAAAGLADETGWCPVDQATFESRLVPGVHVVGDACIAGKMPKSGFSANSQAKVAAAAIVALLAERDPISPSYANTCYSFVAPEYAISVAAVYRLGADGTIESIPGAGGVSPVEADAEFRRKEAEYAQGWYDSITDDAFG